MANNYLLFSTMFVLKNEEEKALMTKYLAYFDAKADDEDVDKAGKELGKDDLAYIAELSVLRNESWHIDYRFTKVQDPDAAGQAELPAVLFISDEGNDIEPVAAAIHLFLRRTQRKTRSHVFTWACTCSKPRVDEFYGGACLVTAKDIYWMSSTDQVDYLMHIAKRAERHAKRAERLGA